MENNSPIIIRNAIELLRNQLATTGNFAFANVTNLIESQYQYDEKNHLINNEHNEEINQRIVDEVYKATNTQALLTRVQATADTVFQIFNETLAYFSENFGRVNQDIIRQGEGITNIANQVILYVLDTGNLNEHIINPAQVALSDLISNGATEGAALSTMTNKIQERFYHYIAPIAQTELEQYYRELNTLFANNFELVWIQYIREPSAADRRDFCSQYDHEFTNAAYHIEEVKQWPQENNNNWGGMVPGTNAANILINAGGYNCLHSFNYVRANLVSESDKSRAKNKGLI